MVNPSSKLDGSDTSKGLAPQEGGEGPGVLSPNRNAALVAATQVYPSTTLRQTTHANEQSNATGTESLKTAKKKPHPKPVNRSAKEHLAALLKLGYSGFSDVDIDCWEPRYPNESSASFNARRQKECGNMADFIEEQQALEKKKRSKKAADDSSDEDDNNSASSWDADHFATLQAENETLKKQYQEVQARLKVTMTELELERSARLEAEKGQSVKSTPKTDMASLENTLKEIDSLTAAVTKEQAKSAKLERELEAEQQKTKKLSEEFEQEKSKRKKLASEFAALEKRLSGSTTSVDVNEIVCILEDKLEAIVQKNLTQLKGQLQPQAASTPQEIVDKLDFQLPRKQRKKKERTAEGTAGTGAKKPLETDDTSDKH